MTNKNLLFGVIKPERSFKKFEKSSGKIFSGFCTVVFSGSDSFSTVDDSVAAVLVSNFVVGTVVVLAIVVDVVVVEVDVEVVVEDEVVDVLVVDVLVVVDDVVVDVGLVASVVKTGSLADLTDVNDSMKTVVVAIVVSASSISNPHSKFSPSTKFCPKDVVVGATTVV